jgi:hypothetical protein
LTPQPYLIYGFNDAGIWLDRRTMGW